MKKILLLTIVISYFYLGTNAQEVIATSGNYSETTTGSLSWTIGEPIIESISNTNNILTQGFQQNTLTVTTINELHDLDMNIIVYPNPTSDYLSIKIKTDKQEKFRISLFDLNGRLIIQKEFSTEEEILDMQTYNPAIYILKISTNNKEIKTYKIVKH